jgi:hypothetical protein
MHGNDRAARKQRLLARIRFVTTELPQLVAEAFAFGLPSEGPELIAAERALADWLKQLERSPRANA